MTTVLVTGATGTVGHHVVAGLVRRGARVRALARHARTAFAGFAMVEPIDADLVDTKALAGALDGVERVFLLTPLEASMVEITVAAVEALRRAGIGRIVRLSAHGAGAARPNTLGRVHREVERAIEASAVPWTFLRPNSFMQNFATYCAGTIRESGAFYMPQGAGRVSVVDARDVAAAAVVALAEPGHAGRAYELTGGVALSNDEVAEALSSACGRHIRYVDVPADEARTALEAAGVPAWNVAVIMELYAMCRAGEAATVSGDLQRILGRAPGTFARYARQHRDLFLP